MRVMTLMQQSRPLVPQATSAQAHAGHSTACCSSAVPQRRQEHHLRLEGSRALQLPAAGTLGLARDSLGELGPLWGDRGVGEEAPEPFVGLRGGSPGGCVLAAGLRRDPTRDPSWPARALCSSGVGAGLSPSSWAGVGMLAAGVRACRPKLASVRASHYLLRQRTGSHASGSIMAVALTHHTPEVGWHSLSGMTEAHAWLGAVSACHAQRARMGETNDCGV